MKDLKSRVAYLQGLSAGLNINDQSGEGKLLSGIIDVLNDFAENFGHLENVQDQLEDYLETIDEDLYHLEDEVYDATEEDEAEDMLEVDCPSCGETVLFSTDVMEDEDIIEVTCPNCDQVVFVNDDTYDTADEPERLENRRPHMIEDDL